MFIPLEVQSRDPNETDIKYKIALIMSCGSLLGCLILLVTSSYFGRLKQLRFGLAGTALFTVLLGLFPSSVYIYAAGFFLAIMAVVPISMLYLYTPEAFSTETRTVAFATCLVCHRIAPICSPWVVTAVLVGVGFQWACVLFGGLFGLTLLITFALTTETFGRSMVEDDDERYDIVDMSKNEEEKLVQ